MVTAELHRPAALLHEAFCVRSRIRSDCFELYYRGKRLEGEAALESWGVGRDAIIEVKMRGRGGAPSMTPSGASPSPLGVTAEAEGGVAVERLLQTAAQAAELLGQHTAVQAAIETRMGAFAVASRRTTVAYGGVAGVAIAAERDLQAPTRHSCAYRGCNGLAGPTGRAH